MRTFFPPSGVRTASYASTSRVRRFSSTPAKSRRGGEVLSGEGTITSIHANHRESVSGHRKEPDKQGEVGWGTFNQRKHVWPVNKLGSLGWRLNHVGPQLHVGETENSFNLNTPNGGRHFLGGPAAAGINAQQQQRHRDSPHPIPSPRHTQSSNHAHKTGPCPQRP